MDEFKYFNICPCCSGNNKDAEEEEDELVSQDLIEFIANAVAKEISNVEEKSS